MRVCGRSDLWLQQVAENENVSSIFEGSIYSSLIAGRLTKQGCQFPLCNLIYKIAILHVRLGRITVENQSKQKASGVLRNVCKLGNVLL